MYNIAIHHSDTTQQGITQQYTIWQQTKKRPITRRKIAIIKRTTRKRKRTATRKKEQEQH